MNDLRVSVEVGLAINLGNFNNLKPTIRIDGINPGVDVEAQIKEAIGAARQVWAAVDEELERAVLELQVTKEDKPVITEKIKQLEMFSVEAREALNKIIPKLNELVDERKA